VWFLVRRHQSRFEAAQKLKRPKYFSPGDPGTEQWNMKNRVYKTVASIGLLEWPIAILLMYRPLMIFGADVQKQAEALGNGMDHKMVTMFAVFFFSFCAIATVAVVLYFAITFLMPTVYEDIEESRVPF
jgi:phage shock protein PspC (stress-responsive transcriptional regulator)